MAATIIGPEPHPSSVRWPPGPRTQCRYPRSRLRAKRFVTTGNVAYEFLDCLDGVGWCPQEPWLTSVDGNEWVESTGPDGVPGPDRETYLAATAALGDRTVALGMSAEGTSTAWLMDTPE